MIYIEKTTWSGYINKTFPKLSNDIECDVLVIGGGLCGILCAYKLTEAGKKVVVLEANNICGKKSSKTTATITAIEDVMYYDLIDTCGFDKAKLYLEANLMALNEYRKLSKQIDFDFEECSSYKYSMIDDGEIEKEVAAIKALGYHCLIKEHIDLPIKIEKALEFKNQGQMNPLKLVDNLINGLEIYEDSKVTKIKENFAFTENNKIKFTDVIVCTGFPFLKVKGLFFLKMYQKKSHVIEVFDNHGSKGNGVGTQDNDIYFRNYKDSVLLGCSDERTGYNCNAYDKINKLIVNKYDVRKIKNRWMNIDTITLDKMPYIGTYTSYDENIYIATGFNMWGMTKSMLAANIITDLIYKKENRFAKLFSPQRKMLFKPLMKNIGSAVKEMVKFKTKRCKHLGCPLYYNEMDQTYECRCHGSKYDSYGNIIDTPTQKKINIKK